MVYHSYPKIYKMRFYSKIAKKINTTKAENFPDNISFSKIDWLSLLFIPLIFLNSYIFQFIVNEKQQVALADSLFRGLLFIIIILLYRPALKLHWLKFKQGKMFSWLLVFLGAIILQIVISTTRSFLPQSKAININLSNTEELQVTFLLIIVSLGPIFTALIEDIVFRYTLLHKLFTPNILWRISIVIINSIIFGLLHYNNFDGNILSTISFMTAGLFLNLFYLWTKNIWYVLLIHILNNFFLSTFSLLIIWIIHLFN